MLKLSFIEQQERFSMVKAEKSAASLHVSTWFLVLNTVKGLERDRRRIMMWKKTPHHWQPSAISPVHSNAVARHLDVFIWHTPSYRNADRRQWVLKSAGGGSLKGANLTSMTIPQHTRLASAEKLIPPWHQERFYWASNFPLQTPEVLKFFKYWGKKS